MIYLTRLEHFNAAHKLYNPGWSKEKNEAVFGPCANENWHGHNFELYVTIKGEINEDTGFLMDAKNLKKLINEQVIEKVDHKNLNTDVDFLKEKMCSTENLATGIWQQLEPHLPKHVKLHCIKLYETPRIYVEYFGDQNDNFYMNNKVAVYRKEHFNAAHRLFNPAWSEEKNNDVFGKCNNPNYHGHNYELIVKVTGEPQKETGYVIDLKVLSDIIKKEVLKKFDHRNLNLDLPEFKDINPTAENIAVLIYNLLRAKIDEQLELQVRLYETDRNYVEYPA